MEPRFNSLNLLWGLHTPIVRTGELGRKTRLADGGRSLHDQKSLLDADALQPHLAQTGRGVIPQGTDCELRGAIRHFKHLCYLQPTDRPGLRRAAV